MRVYPHDGWVDGDGFDDLLISAQSANAAYVLFGTSTLIDADGDGFAGGGGPDCDDDDTIFPGATEIADDGIDQDCDGFDLTAGGGDELGAVRAALDGLPDSDFSDNPKNKNKARNNRRWFDNQLNAIEDNLEAGLFDAALDNANNLLRKVDGCENQGAPDPND